MCSKLSSLTLSSSSFDMTISMSFISCKWVAASGHSPSCINTRNQAYEADSILKWSHNKQNIYATHTLRQWPQFEHNSGGKLLSSCLEKLYLSIVGVMGGSLEIDGCGVQVDWYCSTIWSTSIFWTQRQYMRQVNAQKLTLTSRKPPQDDFRYIKSWGFLQYLNQKCTK